MDEAIFAMLFNNLKALIEEISRLYFAIDYFYYN